MAEFPHHYDVTASGAPDGTVEVSSPGLDPLATAPPAQFGGPGDRWSPETLLVAAAVDCFILTFRAVSRASQLPWTRLRCSGTGTLDRAEGGMRFTALALDVHLAVPAGVDAGRARRLLEKAEKSCLVTRSLAFEPTLAISVETA